MWYNDRLKLAALLDAMDLHGLIDGSDLDEVLFFLRHPQRWQREWEHFQERGSLISFEQETD